MVTDLKSSLSKEHLLVSIAAGISIKDLQVGFCFDSPCDLMTNSSVAAGQVWTNCQTNMGDWFLYLDKSYSRYFALESSPHVHTSSPRCFRLSIRVLVPNQALGPLDFSVAHGLKTSCILFLSMPEISEHTKNCSCVKVGLFLVFWPKLWFCNTSRLGLEKLEL